MSLLITLITPVHSQSFQSFINYLNSIPESERMAAVDSFMTAVEPLGFPYITQDTANFIYRGVSEEVMVAGDFNGWTPSADKMNSVGGTDFFYLSRDFEMNARLDYKYILDNTYWILDPLNPKTCAGGFGPNSELAMPGYIQPWEIESYAGTPQGVVIADHIASANTNSTFQLQIYLPHYYDQNLSGGYPAVYFQDGHEYLSLGYADDVLDNLIDSNLCSPVIGVFVRPNNRNEEYAGSLREAYQEFFALELVPYIDSKYNTIPEARARAVIGDSFGGNISALIAYNHADVFGNCGLHSGAFWPNGYEAYHLVTQGETRPIRWVSVWGTYEGLWENMRAFRDFLLETDYDLHWQELPEGHSWGLWRATIDEMVPFFFPTGFMGAKDMYHTSTIKIRATPNPAREYITLFLQTEQPTAAHITLAGIHGEAVLEVSFPLNAGGQTKILPVRNMASGLYIIRIMEGKREFLEKVILIK